MKMLTGANERKRIHVTDDSSPSEEMFLMNMSFSRLVRLFGLFFLGAALAVVSQYFEGFYSKSLFIVAVLLAGAGSLLFWLKDLKRR